MKTKERLMALLTTVVITGSNLLSLGGQVIAADTSLPEQNTKTNISNVQFNTYFEGNVHEKTFLIEEGGKMYIELNVQENGYLKNGTIKINNGNYTIDTKNTNSDFIQKIENEAIYLKQIQYNQKLLVELPIKFAKESKRDVFSRKSEISLNGIYVDGNGREKELKKTITNLVKWNAKPQVELNGEITKYIPYKNGEEYGLLVQAKINSGIKDNLLPISKTILEVSVPKIEEILPERVTVIANNTKATNGIENGTNFGTENYTYDKENSKITIQTNNEADSQGKIAWEEGKDEYLVTYIYTGEEIYNKTVEKLNNASQTKLTEEEIKEGKTNENAINGQISVNAKISVYEETETTVELSGNLPYAVEETKGEITDFNLISDNNISKGYIYANYAKTEKAKVGKTIEAKIETEFDLKYFASIYDINLNKQITFNMAKEKLLTDETEQDNNNNIITKQIKINETSFNKLLGTDGKIEILSSAGETIGIINTNSTKDENANFMLDISSKKINEIQIKTTSPIAEGTLEINVQKAFVTDQSFTKEQMETFEKMKIEMTGKSNITTKQLSGEIELKEPVSKANISIETKGLSTVVVNKDVDIRVVLDTSSIENALYKNPLIEIQMPSQIQKIEIKDVNLLLEDELKIKETNVIEKDGKQYIQLILEGTQTKYQTIDKTSEDSNVVSKGANIIITTDITLNPLAPSKTEEINMYYINENTNLYEETYKPQPKARTYSRATLAVEDEGEEYGKTSTGVTIVAPAGLVAAHIMSGFDDKNEPLTNISDEKKIATIKTYGESKTVKIEGNVINNNENPIENVFVLGRVPFKGNKIIDKDTSLGTTFDMPMTSKLEVNGIDSTKLKIYYSTNGEATKDLLTAANGWTENPTDLSKIKSYLIVVIGELDKAAQFTFEYEVKLPENLSHNNNSETVYKVYFDNKREDSTIGESKTSGIVGITTGAGPELKITLSSNMPKDTYYEKIVPQEERETQTNEDIRVLPDKNAAKFKAVVENTGGTTATNVVLTINNPAGTDVVEFNETIGDYEGIEANINIGDLKPGEKREIEYYLYATAEMVNMINRKFTTSVSVKANNMTGTLNSNDIFFRIYKAAFNITNKTNTVETESYTQEKVYNYNITLSNNNQENNVTITVPLPDDAEVTSAYWTGSAFKDTEGIEIQKGKIIAKKLFSLSKKNLIITFKLKEEKERSFSTQVFAQAEDVETKQVLDFYYSNEQFIYTCVAKLEGTQKQPEKVYVKEGENFYYNFEIKTSEKGSHTNFILEDTLPEEVELIKGEVVIIDTQTGKQVAIKEIKEIGNKITVKIPRVEAQNIIEIKFLVKGYLNSKNDDGKAIINKATISSDQVEKTEINSVTQYLEYYENAYANPITGRFQIQEQVEVKQAQIVKIHIK